MIEETDDTLTIIIDGRIWPEWQPNQPLQIIGKLMIEETDEQLNQFKGAENGTDRITKEKT